jgi:LPS-assembly lipoprotein
MDAIAAMTGLLALGGCGFAPLYGGGGAADVARQMDEVQVANIPERTGQLLRLSLQDHLQIAGTPSVQLYVLTVNYGITSQDIGVQQDTSSTRNRFVADASWTLSPIGNPTAKLATGQASTEDAENVIDQQYFAVTLETDTINQQLADEIAGQITQQVAVYFKTHPAG